MSGKNYHAGQRYAAEHYAGLTRRALHFKIQQWWEQQALFCGAEFSAGVVDWLTDTILARAGVLS